jgi:hypothetical protein
LSAPRTSANIAVAAISTTAMPRIAASVPEPRVRKLFSSSAMAAAPRDPTRPESQTNNSPLASCSPNARPVSWITSISIGANEKRA